MKHKLLVPVVLLCGLSAMAQNKATAHGKINSTSKQSPAHYLSKIDRKKSPSVQPQAMKNSQSAVITTTASWNNFTSSMNIYGVIIDGQKPLHYNPYVNAVSFIHRKSPSYVAAPDNNSGAMVAEVSTNWGATWDSTCFWSDGVNLGRYPQGAIYSAPGNSSINNAYIVGSGIITDGTNFIGSWYGSKQLGTYNSGADLTPNAMQVQPNYAPYASTGKHDYSVFSFASTNDGKVRSMAYICNDINAADPGLRGYRIINGSYNAGVFNWTSDSIVAPVQKRNDSSMYLSYTPIMAWSENGTIGYAITIGVRAGSTGSNKGFQPIIYKTSNSGLSWSLLSGINFASPTYSTILQRLEPVPNSTLVIPHFQTPEGIDATVDMYGNLHLATTISSSAINDQDSLDYTQTFTTENYSWDFSPGKKPYLYDFIGDGSGPWKYITVDTITSEGPSDVSGNPGFSDNPWDDNGGKVRSGSRIQLSRTPDGRYIIYTWAESNPAFTFGGKTWNTDPDVKVRVMDVSNAGLYTMSPTKINVTSIGNNSYVSARGMFHFTSPVSSVQTNTSSTAVSFTLPVTVTNSYPYTQGSPNTHWYARTKLDFALPIPTAIQESNIIDMSSNATVYPNPTKDNTTLTIDLKENAHVDIVIYDVVGKQMNHITANGNIGSNSITLDMNGFAKGIYFVNVKAGNISSTKKVIIE